MEEGVVHWRAGANQPAQLAKPARPPCTRVPSLLPRLDTAASRTPDRVRPAARRGRHVRPPTPRPPLRPWTASVHPPLPPPLRARASSLSRIRSVRTPHHRRHWSPELCSGRSSSTRAPFFDSSFPELRYRFAVAGHASKRLVTHGETLLALAFFSAESAVAARVATVPFCAS